MREKGKRGQVREEKSNDEHGDDDGGALMIILGLGGGVWWANWIFDSQTAMYLLLNNQSFYMLASNKV